MNLKQVTELALKPAYSLLPSKMYLYFNNATALLLCIGLQESHFQYRRQIRGPARGFWQFDEAGVHGVINHHASAEHVSHVLGVLAYPHTQTVVHQALADNDTLAACFARLLLYTDPEPLPQIHDSAEDSWDYYLRLWRPGKPHPNTWPDNWAKAVEFVQYTTRGVI